MKVKPAMCRQSRKKRTLIAFVSPPSWRCSAFSSYNRIKMRAELFWMAPNPFPSRLELAFRLCRINMWSLADHKGDSGKPPNENEINQAPLFRVGRNCIECTVLKVPLVSSSQLARILSLILVEDASDTLPQWGPESSLGRLTPISWFMPTHRRPSRDYMS